MHEEIPIRNPIILQLQGKEKSPMQQEENVITPMEPKQQDPSSDGQEAQFLMGVIKMGNTQTLVKDHETK